MLPEAR